MISKSTSRSNQSFSTLKAGLATDWLGQDQHFAKLSRQANRLIELQNLLTKRFRLAKLSVANTETSARLRGASTPLSNESEDVSVLTLMVSNTAQAAKLRQIEPQILEFLRQSGWNFSRIRTRPQTSTAHPVVTAAQPRMPLSQESLAQIARTTDNLPEGPVKTALERLRQNQLELAKRS
jgi:hypothetical protein